jgi:nitrogen fixation protein FixH
MSEEAVSKIDGRHVLAGLAAFFGVMLLANAIFVYYALSTFGGVDTEDAYRRGVAYNATLEAASAQSGLGWRAILAYDEARRSLDVRIADGAGQPVTGLALSGRLLHPATNRLDQILDRFEERAGGLYVRTLEPEARGAWIADLSAQSSGRAPFRIRERLWLQPRS